MKGNAHNEDNAYFIINLSIINVMDSKIECECGYKQYGYYSGNVIVYVCFKCGKFACFGGTKTLQEIFMQDTTVILELIKEGTLKPIDSLNTSDYK